jgi:hypothetical protein
MLVLVQSVHYTPRMKQDPEQDTLTDIEGKSHMTR